MRTAQRKETVVFEELDLPFLPSILSGDPFQDKIMVGRDQDGYYLIWNNNTNKSDRYRTGDVVTMPINGTSTCRFYRAKDFQHQWREIK